MTILLVLAAALTHPASPVLPAVPDMATCEDPAARKAFLQQPPSLSASAYNEEWEAYFNARMEALGMTAQEQGRFAMNMLHDPAFKAAMERGFAAAKSMMADLPSMLRQKDEAIACRQGIALLGKMPAVLSAAEEQWLVMDRALDAEQQRRGDPAKKD